MADLDFDELDKKIQDHIGNPEEQAARMEVKEALTSTSSVAMTNSSTGDVSSPKNQSPAQSEGISIAVNVNKPKVTEAPMPATPSSSIDTMPIRNTLETSMRPSPTKIAVNSTPTSPVARPDRVVAAEGSVPVQPSKVAVPSLKPSPDTTETARTSSQAFGSSHEMDELDLEELSSATEQNNASISSQDDSLIGERSVDPIANPVPTVSTTQSSDSHQASSLGRPTANSVQNKSPKGLNLWDILYYILVVVLVAVIILLALVLLDRYDVIIAPSWLPLT